MLSLRYRENFEADDVLVETSTNFPYQQRITILKSHDKNEVGYDVDAYYKVRSTNLKILTWDSHRPLFIIQGALVRGDTLKPHVAKTLKITLIENVTLIS